MASLHILEWRKATHRAFNFLGNHPNSQCVFSVSHCQYCSAKKSGVRASKLKITRFWFLSNNKCWILFITPLVFYDLLGLFSFPEIQGPGAHCFSGTKNYLDFNSRAFRYTVNTTSLTIIHECWKQLTKQLCTNNCKLNISLQC